MPKIMLEIQIPENGKKYEIVADDRILAKDFIRQISEEIKVYDQSAQMDRNTVLLADKTLNSLLDAERSLSSQKVESGHTLILV